MGSARAGSPVAMSLGQSNGPFANGPIAGGRGQQVVAGQDLTRAMVFTPIAAAVSGLTTIFTMATWASKGNRPMELVSLRSMSGFLADGHR
jgi:hypothetical protein